MADIAIRVPAQLGPVLRSFRKARGMTQAELAHVLGITRQAVSALERKPEVATFERLMRVWAALDLDVVLRERAGAADSGGW